MTTAKKTRGNAQNHTEQQRTVDYDLFLEYAAPDADEYLRMAYHQALNSWMGGLVTERWVDFTARLYDHMREDVPVDDRLRLEIMLTTLVGGAPGDKVIDTYYALLRTMRDMDGYMPITNRQGGAA